VPPRRPSLVRRLPPRNRVGKTREDSTIGRQRHRLLRHGWVLLVAFLLTLAAPRLPGVGGHVSPARGSAVVDAVIVTPPTDPPDPLGPALTVMAPAGATAVSLATRYHRDAAAIIWANGLVAGTNPKPGAEVLVPPGPGALVEVRPGELPSRFAARLHLAAPTLLAYNLLESDTPRPAGSYLQVPLAAAPAGSLNSAAFVPETEGVPEVPPSQPRNAGFPYGQCTYWVATKRAVTWGGNAIDWWPNARGIRPEGHVPVAGAVAVFDYWPIGHVAFVESVSPDGSFVISEMNYGWWGHVDQRTIAPTDPSLVGFIY
jgi:surface antigen